ncbi:MAG: DUF2490 domain-containing protein [Sediminibacterium sp.]
MKRSLIFFLVSQPGIDSMIPVRQYFTFFQPKKELLIVLLVFSCTTLKAQSGRINTYNTIGWFNYLGNYRLSDKTSVHAEYQWRRAGLITDWQQSLLRVGINYHLKPSTLFRVGYAWAETFPYGDIPLNTFGKTFTEHRLYEMLQLSQSEGRFDFIHRLMLEQRWIGKFSSASLEKEDDFVFTNRMRYMFRTVYRLQKDARKYPVPYFAAYDEILIGFGKNVVVNIFDQNRLGCLVGVKLSSSWSLEGGYFNQIVQFSRLVGGQSVLQYNRGIILNAWHSVDWRRKKK